MINQLRNRNEWPRLELGILQLFIGIGAVAGGWVLVMDPSGSQIGMSSDWLSNSPFTTYLIPGLTLLLVNGIGNVLGGIATLRKNRYAGYVAMALGTFLLFWMVAQVWWIGLTHWLQPFYFVFGLIESTLGIELWWALRHPNQRGVIL